MTDIEDKQELVDDAVCDNFGLDMSVTFATCRTKEYLY